MAFNIDEPIYFPSVILKQKLKPFFYGLKNYVEATEKPSIFKIFPYFLEDYLMECVMAYGGDITAKNYKILIEDLLEGLDDLITDCYRFEALKRDKRSRLKLKHFPEEFDAGLLGFIQPQDDQSNDGSDSQDSSF